MKKETKVTCPACGTEFETPKKEVATVAMVIGSGAGLGIILPSVATEQPHFIPSLTAKQRIDAMKKAGMDVSNMYAMTGADGGEFIGSMHGGKFVVLEDNNPIFSIISNQGTVPNRSLFRRFVMAQMFHMMSYIPHGKKEPVGVTEMIHRLGYEYQWKMTLNELNAQMKMEGKDPVNFADRNRWFHVGTVLAMVEDYIEKLKMHVKDLPLKRCKKIPYKHIGGQDIFVEDIQAKLYNPLNLVMRHIAGANNAAQLYNAVKKFNDMRIKLSSDTPQCKEWEYAYKGAGAFFTMQNLIRFHNCVIINEAGFPLDKDMSLHILSLKAQQYMNEGWRLLALMKKMIEYNNINVSKKIKEWRKRK